MKKYLAFAMFVVLAIALTSPFSVSAKTKAGTKSGSFFYFFDKAIEKTNLFFTFNPEKKAKKALENAEERLAEAEESASENKPEAVKTAMENYQKNIEVLEKVLIKVPEKAKEAIEKAIEADKERWEEMTKKIEEINNEIKKEDNDFKKDEEKKSNDDVSDNENKDEENGNGNEDENKKDEQKKEIEKLKKEVETLKQKQPQVKIIEKITEKEKPIVIEKKEEVRNSAEETTKKVQVEIQRIEEDLARTLSESEYEKKQKEQEEAEIKAKQEQLRESQRLSDQRVAEEKQKELERQQQLENQRLAAEKAIAPIDRDVTPPVISEIRVRKLENARTVVDWVTNEPTLGTVNFGGNMSCSINGCQDAYSSFGIFKQSESYELDHQIIIDRDLEPATEYKYYIYATDKAGNKTGFYDGKIVTEPSVPLPELKGQYNTDLVLTKNKSPYTVTGDVFINKKLQIEPGVEIKFNGDYEIVVNEGFGVIKVNGTKNEPVSLELNQSIDTSNRGVLIRSNNDNIIDNTIIESGYNGISIDSESNSKRAKATISNSTIKNNVSVGIFVRKSDVKIINNKITQNRIGIQSVLNSITEISQNNISDNSFIALVFTDGSTPQLKFNNIYGNNDIMRIHAHSDLAIATLSQNNISLESNKGYIYFGSQSTSEPWNSTKGEINAQNNWWGTEDVVIIKQRIKEYNNVSFNYQPIATFQFAEAGVQ